MAIEDLFDHEATIYTLSETTTVALRSRRNVYAEVAVEACAISPPRFGVRNEGAGARKEGSVTVYMRADVELKNGDVIVVDSGPNAPKTLKVIGDPDYARGHHTEAFCEPFTGELNLEPVS